MYYGGENRALYYGGKSPVAYAAPAYATPAYYGGSAYGGGAYGASYGMGMGGADDGDSLFGNFSLLRIFRVCLQRWVTIVVFVIIGFAAAFAVFKISPVIYESFAIIEMRMRASTYTGLSQAVIDMDRVTNMQEVFNTRLARLRSSSVVEQVVAQYRGDYPSSIATDGELLAAIGGSKMELIRQSRLIKIAVRSTDAQLAMDLANAYAKVAETSTSDQNRNESEVAVAWLSATTEQMKRNLSQADQSMLDFCAVNQLDAMKRDQDLQSSALAKYSSEILSLEESIAMAEELTRTLSAIQNDPEKFGSLPDSIPRSGEISRAFDLVQKTIADKNALLARYTANHPEVKIREKELEVYRKQFADVVFRALETARANKELKQHHLDLVLPKRDAVQKRLDEIEEKINIASVRIDQLRREREVADLQFKNMLKRTSEAQLAADENTAIIKPVEPAKLPRKPVLPNPLVIFPLGVIGGLGLGFLFVMMLDHLEDKIIGINDIEERLRLKVLAVFPHVRRKKRIEVARLTSEDKFSQFSEAVASLRNLLDSPRYHSMSKVMLCMSTQPGEGKTISSCSIAQAYAQSGQKTLLVDFDMRRPRLATIFDKRKTGFKSLPEVLLKGDVSEFDSLPIPSGVDENLSLVLSRSSSKVTPSVIMGSDALIAFFKWAREHYDHIIIDTPPFGIVGDVMTLSSLVDSVMMMCRPESTRFRMLKHAARQLTESGAHVIGVIVNDVDFGNRSHYDRYSYHYSYRYGKRYGYGYGGGYYGRPKDEEKEDEAATASTAGEKTGKDGQAEPGSSAQPATAGETSREKGGPAVERQDIVDVSLTDDD